MATASRSKSKSESDPKTAKKNTTTGKQDEPFTARKKHGLDRKYIQDLYADDV